MDRKSEVEKLQQTHDQVMKEVASAVPQIDDPTVLKCSCGPKQVCKICPPEKKVKYLELQEKKTMERTKKGVPRYLVLTEHKSGGRMSQKLIKQHMAKLKQVAEYRLGRKLSNREFRAITEQRAREIYEAELREQAKAEGPTE